MGGAMGCVALEVGEDRGRRRLVVGTLAPWSSDRLTARLVFMAYSVPSPRASLRLMLLALCINGVDMFAFDQIVVASGQIAIRLALGRLIRLSA